MQLELFDEVLIGSNKLIDALNCGRKPKEMYCAHAIHKIGELYLLSCVASVNDYVFNILDKNGKTPPEYGACWRLWQIVSKELNIQPSDLSNYEIVYIGRGLNGKNNGKGIQ